MTAKIELTPIAYVRGGRSKPDDDAWGAVEASVELAPDLPDEALAGLDAFSHLLVVFQFHKLDPSRVATGSRRPRGNPAWPEVGVFAQRGSPRPNRLGVTACEILSLASRAVRVRGLDAIDGTPVLDMKPVMRGFEPRGVIREPDWASDIMRNYW
jgi:tRNA-Thr(GGU) m(6)t(6)A37 methyltransferase TsaA